MSQRASQSISQVLSSFPKRHAKKILCSYVNATSHIQIIKITNIRDFYFEKVVFPGQRILFEALPEAQLEVFASELMHAIVKDRILCQALFVQQSENPAFPVSETPDYLSASAPFMELPKISIKEDVLL
jgi:hypothetical protein